MHEEHAGHEVSGHRRRWVWRMRQRVRSAPGSRHVYRLLVGIIGLAVTVGGLALVPLPGPGWLIVFVGLAILASEFVWAQRLLDVGRAWLAVWTQWLLRKAFWVRIAVGLVTVTFVAGVAYLLLVWRGAPSWLLQLVDVSLPGV